MLDSAPDNTIRIKRRLETMNDQRYSAEWFNCFRKSFEDVDHPEFFGRVWSNSTVVDHSFGIVLL